LHWRDFSASLTRFAGWWDEMAHLVEVLRADEQVELVVGFDPDVGPRAEALWRGILDPILQRYQSEKTDWLWDEQVALALITAWREAQSQPVYRRQTLAPLHNCKSMSQPTEIEPGLMIRQFTDADRTELWQTFGGEHFPGPINPTIPDLEAWETVIDFRWALDRKPPLSSERAVEVIRDTVRALRLHHPGITGTTVIWHRPDPAEMFAVDPLGNGLFAPLGTGPGLFMDRLTSHVGQNCAKPLRVLLQTLRDAESNKRLALAVRRLDAAYLRLDPEDRLLDLWIAFEALMLPDASGELSYRVAVRIAQLLGGTGEEKRAAFNLARSSYKVRSEVVHGKASKEDLGKVVEQTRELARRTIKTWLLDPPGDASGLDDAIWQ
jgi:Apea-like HEPN